MILAGLQWHAFGGMRSMAWVLRHAFEAVRSPQSGYRILSLRVAHPFGWWPNIEIHRGSDGCKMVCDDHQRTQFMVHIAQTGTRLNLFSQFGHSVPYKELISNPNRLEVLSEEYSPTSTLSPTALTAYCPFPYQPDHWTFRLIKSNI